jgi:uncharacterized repeat protein (TIGR03843 family)
VPADERPPEADVTAAADRPAVDPLRMLREGDISVRGRMPWSSNATFLVDLCCEGVNGLGVYKPSRGERDLWDFPDGIYRREVAAWLLSEALGWGIVPPTVIRPEGPMGEGSVQWFVPADFEQHYFTLYEAGTHIDALRTVCAFDLLANNTDRKSGHVLLGEDGRIWAIDNALTFHADFKLRTVIWEFATEPIPVELLSAIMRLAAGGLPPELAALLSPSEQDALLQRARAVVHDPHFPVDPSGRRYPWPLV